MNEISKEIVFEPPGPDEPGYLKRTKQALVLSNTLLAGGTPDPDAIDDIVSFLLPYVKAPEDRDEAGNLLWDASENQFLELMDLVSGGAISKSRNGGDGGDKDKPNPTT